mmetsp:Transcript_25279/g.53317  ORF Transcript_25279/g.53317 Transcript_25279/m.53317 type:complete len:83 (-) Transcript_25279:819-1067(-)
MVSNGFEAFPQNHHSKEEFPICQPPNWSHPESRMNWQLPGSNAGFNTPIFFIRVAKIGAQTLREVEGMGVASFDLSCADSAF